MSCEEYQDQKRYLNFNADTRYLLNRYRMTIISQWLKVKEYSNSLLVISIIDRQTKCIQKYILVVIQLYTGNVYHEYENASLIIMYKNTKI